MIAALRWVGPAGRRSDAGEIAEVVDEVGLIGVAELCGHRGPVDGKRAAQEANDPLHAAHAGKAFGRHTDLVAEAAHKSLGEKAQAFANLGNGDTAFEGREGQRHGRIVPAGQMLQEGFLE